jgi:isochorismate synthase EntC
MTTKYTKKTMKNPPKFCLDSFLSSGAVLSWGSDALILGWGKKILSEKPEKFPSFYFNDFFLTKSHPFFHYEHHLKIDSEEFHLMLPASKESVSLNWNTPAWDLFESAFSSISEGTVQKIVPYVEKKAPLEMTPSLLAVRLRSALTYLQAHPHTFLYGCWEGGKGTLGVTPEVLFRLDLGKPISTMACAGTFSKDDELHWQSNEKLIKEHELVIEGIKADLAPYGTIHAGKTEPRRFSKLTHLVTPLEFHPKKTLPAATLIEKLHPTPALGGFPKNESSKWLKAYGEKLPREGFGAPFGVLLHEGTGVFYVAIRNMEWNSKEVILRAGCGITAESTFEDEKQEAENKMKAIQEILSL